MRWNRSRPRRHAFTLIEIMVVVAIMAVVLAMGIPSIYNLWHKEAMRQAVADFVEVCSTARARAILQGTMTEVVFKGGEGTISLSGGAAKGTGAPGSVNSTAGTAMRLPENIAISRLMVSGVNGMDYEQIRVRFFPNGTCDDLVLHLRSDKGEQVEITLELTTGLTQVKYDWNEFRLR